MIGLPEYLHAVHDTDGAHLMDGFPGWVVITEAIGHDPHDRSGHDYSDLKRRGLGVVVRANNAHDGENGTIPLPEHYTDFAQRCANFVVASTGIDIVVLGNEPNLEGERPNVNGVRQIITAQDYARCYKGCRAAIKRVRGDLPVWVAALAPWNNQSGPWLEYLGDIALAVDGEADGFALHAYTHGPDPDLVFSDEKQHGWYWHFRTYRDQLAAIRAGSRRGVAHLRFGITETDQNEPWLDADSGWVHNTYNETSHWNRTSDMPILFVAQYRSNRDDKWSFADKEGVKKDFRKAVEYGYKAPRLAAPPQKPGQTYDHELNLPNVSNGQAAAPTVPPATNPMTPRLVEWGATLKRAQVQPGQTYWEVIAADGPLLRGGNVNIYVDAVDEHGQRLVGVPIEFYWDDGHWVSPTEAKPDEPDQGTNMPMSAGGNAYGVRVADGNPSDDLFGMGMVPWQEHHSYRVKVQRKVAAAAPASTPAPSQPATIAYVAAPAGANLRAAPINGQILMTILYGEQIQILDLIDTSGWARVRYGHRDGFMATSLFGTAKPPPNAPAPNVSVPALAHPIADPAWRAVGQGWGANPTYYARYLYDGVPLRGHNGIDFPAPLGTPVCAVADGVVTKVELEAEGFGLHALVAHTWGESLYAHLNSILVKPGALISRGDQIGTVGSTGTSTGNHLHFGLRLKGYNRADGWGGFVDPTPYLINTGAPAPSDDLESLLKTVATEFGLQRLLFAALAWNESSWRPEIEGGGLFQIGDDAWSDWADDVGATDRANARDNARVAAAYFSHLLGRYNGDERKAIWAWNWGPSRIDDGQTPPAITQEHASKILACRDFAVALKA